ncbi:purine permease [Acetobacter lambici]|uniref:solute carrier family 23 protein n=1 Tax=Acetobacter lambici TaxID=1332824 RepID=UPI00140DABDA|nr:purine permease [Acetobacter lambici]
MSFRLETNKSGTTSGNPVDEILPLKKLVVYGVQHVCTFYAAAVIVPIILANALHLSRSDLLHLVNADLFTCGLASLIQSVGIGRIGVRLPLLQGVTFTAMVPMVTIGVAAGGGTEGLREIYGAILIAGLFAFFIGRYFSTIVRFFPPVVMGSTILIVGLALLPIAANGIVGGQSPSVIQSSVDIKNVYYALGTFFIIIIMQRMLRGFLATIAVLLGLLLSSGVAMLLGDMTIHEYNTLPWLAYTQPFYFGMPVFHIAPILSMTVVMVIAMIETSAGVYAIGSIVKRKISADDIASAIQADGLATVLGSIFNSFPYTCYAENVGLVRMTGVRSRWVIVAASVIMIILSSFPVAAALVASIPAPVLGGAALAMFATVAMIGVQILSEVDFDDHNNMTISGASVALSILITAQPHITESLPPWIQIVFGSGITVGALTAIILSLLFNHVFPAVKFGKNL